MSKPRRADDIYIDDLLQQLVDILASCEGDFIAEIYNGISGDSKVKYIEDGFFRYVKQ